MAFDISGAEQIQTNVSEFNPERKNIIRSGINVSIEYYTENGKNIATKVSTNATNWSLLRPFMNNRNQRKFSVKYLCFPSEIRQKKLRIPEKISRPEMKLSVHSKFSSQAF